MASGGPELVDAGDTGDQSNDGGQFPLTGLDGHFQTLLSLTDPEFEQEALPATTLPDAISSLDDAMKRKLEGISLDIFLARGKLKELTEAQKQLKDIGVSMDMVNAKHVA